MCMHGRARLPRRLISRLKPSSKLSSTPTKVRVARTDDRRCACVSPATQHHADVRLDVTCSRLCCMITM